MTGKGWRYAWVLGAGRRHGALANLCYPTTMKTIVQFTISREDEIYTADGVNVPIVTEGATFEELQENIRDALMDKT